MNRKGFKITYMEEEITILADDDPVILSVTYQKGLPHFYAGTFSEENDAIKIWIDDQDINPKESIAIELIDINTVPSEPIKMVKNKMPAAKKSKLEIFRELEHDLKKSGLL